MVVAILLPAVAGAQMTDRPGALAQAKLCWNTPGAAGVEACRRALAVGLVERRVPLVEQALAVKLAGLERWDEAVEVYRDAARKRPRDGEAQLRLGAGLLHLLRRAEEAEPVLREAIRLRPTDPVPLVHLGTALHRLGRAGEAVSAFEGALRLNPSVLDHRPAARVVLEAARQQRVWP